MDTIDARLSAIERRLDITRGVPERLRNLDEQIEVVRRHKDAALDARDFGKAAALRDAERDLLAQRTRVMAETETGEGTGTRGPEGTGPEEPQETGTEGPRETGTEGLQENVIPPS